MTQANATVETKDQHGSARRFLTDHEPEAARRLLAAITHRSAEETNLLGVALMRLGRYKEAVALYRGLMYSTGSVVATQSFPVHFKLNFATALLGEDNLEGFLNFVMETPRNIHPEAERLWHSYEEWLNNMSFATKLLWRLGLHQPNRLPRVPFPPGAVE